MKRLPKIPGLSVAENLAMGDTVAVDSMEDAGVHYDRRSVVAMGHVPGCVDLSDAAISTARRVHHVRNAAKGAVWKDQLGPVGEELLGFREPSTARQFEISSHDPDRRCVTRVELTLR